MYVCACAQLTSTTFVRISVVFKARYVFTLVYAFLMYLTCTNFWQERDQKGDDSFLLIHEIHRLGGD